MKDACWEGVSYSLQMWGGGVLSAIIYTQNWKKARSFPRKVDKFALKAKHHVYCNLKGGGGCFPQRQGRKKKKEYMYTKLKRSADFPKECVF